MPAQPTYPGVYIEEVPSGVRTITGVSTSVTAFIGRAARGMVNTPVRVQSFAEYTRLFGGLWQPSRMSYAVSQFFQHGGAEALIVRVHNGDVNADRAGVTLDTGGASNSADLVANSPGDWGEALRVTVEANPDDATLFNVLVEELAAAGSSTVVASEIHLNLSADPANPRYYPAVLNNSSAYIEVSSAGPDGEVLDPVVAALTAGDDGSDITDSEILGNRDQRTGVYALEDADIFNLLCVPPLSETVDVAVASWDDLAIYCQERRAFLIIDPRMEWTANPSTAVTDAENGVNAIRAGVGNAFAINAMVAFPRMLMPDPLAENRVSPFAPCGAIAGIMARTDAQRGVWKAPAGLQASFSGTQGFTFTLTDAQNGTLNQIGLNCLRSFPVTGHVLWGSRTLAGADQLASEWKYVPVRRFALFLEESLYRGTQWVVFEPNDEPLWAQIRLNLGAFMQNLFRQGAFQGTSPRDAYFVKCDKETTTQNDIDRGIVNIVVGFAPLKPAEFVIIKIQQLAGELQV